jgi:hypothetical protein
MNVRYLAAAAGIAGAVALGAAAPVLAQNCVELCAVTCARPISIPDRWDDATPIPGYDGSPRRPKWQNNGRWNSEALTNDANGNGLYDPGDGYVDENANGQYDRELYDPATTGYQAGPSALAPAGDAGAEFTLTTTTPYYPAPGQYLSIDYPPSNRGIPISGEGEYRENWTIDGCHSGLVGGGDVCRIEAGLMSGPTNQAMRDLIAQDPGAHWDIGTSSVQGSVFPQSPRVILIPVHDPRLPIGAGNTAIHITKMVAFFLDHMTGDAEVRGRFVRAVGSGATCAEPGSGFVVECATPARDVSWGQLKDAYR